MMNYMKWFALLGREKAIVTAELTSITQSKSLDFFGSTAVGSETHPDWDSLGGVIRAGDILGETADKKALAAVALAGLPTPPESGKVSIGISTTALSPRELRDIGKQLKQLYIDKFSKRPRIVYPQTGTLLNAGHLEGNRLLTPPNCELFFIKGRDNWLVGKTSWQQDIASYTQRDRGRPARDARVGMLPPKLAQSMLNLAGVNDKSHVHDPFCGTGVILTEALLKKGNVSGSDASPEMVHATKTNLAWMQQLSGHPSVDFEVFEADAQTVTLPASTTHIVSEGYLGNPDLREDSHARLVEEARTLLPLYKHFFQNIARYSSPLVIVFALPVWFSSTNSAPITLPILDDLPDMGYTVEQFAPDSATTLIYRRPHQTVGRAIIKLRKG